MAYIVERSDFAACKSSRYTPPQNAMVRRLVFPSVSDFAGYVEERGTWNLRGSGASWFGDLSNHGKALAALKAGGHKAHAAAALALMAKIEPPDLSTYKEDALLDVAGGMPCTPAVLSGDPACMLDMRPSCGLGLIRIYVNTVSSAGISATQMQNAGAAVMALGQILSQIRPVELWQVAGMDAKGPAENGKPLGSCITMVRLSNPYSMAEAGLMFGAYGITRGICYGIGIDEAAAPGGWPFDDYAHAETATAAMIPELTDSDLLIGGTSLAQAGLTPEAWLSKHLTLALGAGKEE